MIEQAVVKKALVVDDQLLGRKALESMLEEFNVGVITACDGLEAVESFDESIAVVFIDFNMPKMNGDEATKAIRQKEKKLGKKKPAYIIGLTADNSEAISCACINAGMNAVLKKPIFPEKLKKLLDDFSSQN